MPIPPIFAAINRVHSHFILMPAQVTHCAYGTCGFWAGTYNRYRVFAILPTPQGPRCTGVSNIVTVHVPER